MDRRTFVLASMLAAVAAPRFGWSQTSPLIKPEHLKALISESSGSLAIDHFSRLLAFSGYSPSRGADQTAEYLAARTGEYGLANVHIDRFPSDGKITFWTYATQPAWEATRGDLWIAGPSQERVASFDNYRGHLARFSRTSRVRAALVDVGTGLTARDYEGKDIKGKIVLATGGIGPVHEQAVWVQGAAGVISYRTQDNINYPDLVAPDQIAPWEGPKGEPPTFGFSVSYRTGRRLADRLRGGEPLTLEAEVQAETSAGAYPQVHATISGTDPSLPEVWVYAHDDYRNSGGANNLTGTGATLEMARALSRLIQREALPRPRRNIRFVWGAEHQTSSYYVFKNPDAPKSILAMLDLDMVGYNQQASTGILHLYRTAHSLPSFVNDVVQEVYEVVGAGNAGALRTRMMSLDGGFTMPILDPAGTRDQFYYRIDDFWGPSDHEDVGDGSIAIPSVLINNWPDPFLGTNAENTQIADATQMRRAIVISGAAAWVLATAGSNDIPALAQNAMQKTGARLASEERRAADLIQGSSSASTAPVNYREAQNIVRQAYKREARAIETLESLADTRDAKDYVVSMAREVGLAGEAAAIERLKRSAAVTGKRLGITLNPAAPDSSPASRLVPVRSPQIRGPIRPAWLAEQLKDPHYLLRLRLARRGAYYLYETLNFANGQRTLGEIRDAVAAEYGPAPMEEVEEYFRVLEQAGVVTIRKPGALRS